MDVTQRETHEWHRVAFGSDFCHFYGSRAELEAVLLPFVTAALENHEACLWLTADPLPATAARVALAAAVADLSTREQRAQIEIADLEEWYHRTGPIDAADAWLKCKDAALASGFRGLRLCCNAVEHVPSEPPLAGSFDGQPIVALFSYSLRACSAADVLAVALRHTFTLPRFESDAECRDSVLLERRTAPDSDSRDLDERKNEFLGVLAHELRNPLASILTASQLMALRGGEEQFRKEIEIIQRQVSNASAMVDELLDMSRLVVGRLELERSSVEIADAVNHGIELAAPLVAKRAHRLHVHAPDSGLAVRGDPARLAQVVAALVSNAARFTEPGGDIRIGAERHHGFVTLTVADTGRGIEPERLLMLFEPFGQTREQRRRAGGGLGLGLPIVHKLVELHGGSVNVESTLGRGSRFVVRLPALDAAH